MWLIIHSFCFRYYYTQYCHIDPYIESNGEFWKQFSIFRSGPTNLSTTENKWNWKKTRELGQVSEWFKEKHTDSNDTEYLISKEVHWFVKSFRNFCCCITIRKYDLKKLLWHYIYSIMLNDATWQSPFRRGIKTQRHYG